MELYDDEEVRFVDGMSCPQADGWRITVVLQGDSGNFKIDTGADETSSIPHLPEALPTGTLASKHLVSFTDWTEIFWNNKVQLVAL